MEEKGYNIYLYPRWFIINSAASLAGFLVCLLLAWHTSSTYLLLLLILLLPVFLGLMILYTIPLFRLRKPCMICTPEGIYIHLQFQPRQKGDRSYLGTLQDFIPWNHIHGIHLLERKSRYLLQGVRLLRINYSRNAHAAQADRHCEIFLNQLDVHAKSLYNTLTGLYSRYKAEKDNY